MRPRPPQLPCRDLTGLCLLIAHVRVLARPATGNERRKTDTQRVVAENGDHHAAGCPRRAAIHDARELIRGYEKKSAAPTAADRDLLQKLHSKMELLQTQLALMDPATTFSPLIATCNS